MDISLLLDIGLVKNFSHSVTCQFVLLTVSFALQKLFSSTLKGGLTRFVWVIWIFVFIFLFVLFVFQSDLYVSICCMVLPSRYKMEQSFLLINYFIYLQPKCCSLVPSGKGHQVSTGFGASFPTEVR